MNEKISLIRVIFNLEFIYLLIYLFKNTIVFEF